MSQPTLEERVAALEAAVAGLQRLLPVPFHERPPRQMTPEDKEAFAWMDAVMKYFRNTGLEPPPDWKLGDPIPEPVYGWDQIPPHERTHGPVA